MGRARRIYWGGAHIVFWWESKKERDHYEDLDIDGKIILGWILEK
jgi:hypothetical protein